MKVNAGPEMLDMLLKAAGPGAPAGSLSTLLPLLQGLGGNGSSGGASIASLLPLLQTLGRQQQAPPEPEEAAETTEVPPPEEPRPEAPPDEGAAKGPGAGPRSRKSRRPRFAPDLSANAPALLQLLTSLGTLNQRPLAPPPPPEPPPEDFDPCSLCPDPCPRKNAAISFDQVRALAATFPGYA